MPLSSEKETNKERFVPLSDRTSHTMCAYHSKREDLYPDDYVFSTDRNRKLESRYVQKMLERASQPAGISHIHPHRLRHTFAINYLRVDGDIFTLQVILGHEHLEMVRHYSRLSQSDINKAYRRASPVEFLRLYLIFLNIG